MWANENAASRGRCARRDSRPLPAFLIFAKYPPSQKIVSECANGVSRSRWDRPILSPVPPYVKDRRLSWCRKGSSTSRQPPTAENHGWSVVAAVVSFLRPLREPFYELFEDSDRLILGRHFSRARVMQLFPFVFGLLGFVWVTLKNRAVVSHRD
eukprot:scaffold41151_cov42-Attheya_sp.AAC.2